MFLKFSSVKPLTPDDIHSESGGRMVPAEACLGFSTLHQKKSLLHFYAVEEESYDFLFSDKRKLHFKWRRTLSKKNRICLIKNVSFCQRKRGVENFQPALFCFLYILMGLNFLFQIEERDQKSLNHTFQLPIMCQSIFPSGGFFFFFLLLLACMVLLRQSRLRNSQKFIIYLFFSGAK